MILLLKCGVIGIGVLFFRSNKLDRVLFVILYQTPIHKREILTG